MTKQSAQQLEKEIKAQKEQEKRDNIALDLARQRKQAELFFKKPVPTISAQATALPKSKNNQNSTPATEVPGSTSPDRYASSSVSKHHLNTPTKPHPKRHRPIIDDNDSPLKDLQGVLESIGSNSDDEDAKTRRRKLKGKCVDLGSDSGQDDKNENNVFKADIEAHDADLARTLQLDEYKMDIKQVCHFLFDEKQILLSNTGY